MPTYRLAFRDPPAELIERLKPVLVGQGDPPVYVFPADRGVEFKGPGAEFLLRSRACQALTDVWPGWQDKLAD